jgi:hypothetical protein
MRLPLHDEPRAVLLGRDPHDRLLALIFTCRGKKLRPISGRPMRRKEKESMKTHSKANVRKTRPHGGDAQVREFERRDLGDDIRASRTARVLRRVPKPTSILLDEDLVERLREKGAKRGLGYQTMLKLIVREHLEEY